MNTLSTVLIIAIPSMLAILAIIIGVIVGINRAKKKAPRETTVTDYQTFQKNLEGKPAWVLLAPQYGCDYSYVNEKNTDDIKHFDLSTHNSLFSGPRQGQLALVSILLPRGVNYMKAEFVNSYSPNHVRTDRWTEHAAWAPTPTEINPRHSTAIHILVETLSPASARPNQERPKTNGELAGFIKNAEKNLTEEEKETFLIKEAFLMDPAYANTLIQKRMLKIQSRHTHPTPYLYYRSTQDLCAETCASLRLQEDEQIVPHQWSPESTQMEIFDVITVLRKADENRTLLTQEYFYKVRPNSELHQALQKLEQPQQAQQIPQPFARSVEANDLSSRGLQRTTALPTNPGQIGFYREIDKCRKLHEQSHTKRNLAP